MSTQMPPPVPIACSYWVVPNWFLAGEYPGDLDAQAAHLKIRAFIEAGIDCFVDLTTPEDAMEAYAPLLAELSGGLCRYLFFPIQDYGVPKSHAYMETVLDAIDQALADGRMVYVHCWGGIGRTGTVVGCWLRRHCKKGQIARNQAEAMDLSALWQHNPKSQSKKSPENDDQCRYIANWPEGRRADARACLPPFRDARSMHDGSIQFADLDAVLDRARGCLFGQLAGDSLGSLVEFMDAAAIARRYPDGGPLYLEDGGCFNTLAGQPTDDSEMALLLARSLVQHNGWNAADVLSSYRYWLDSGPFDCGTTIQAALLGQANPDSQANGALMRVAPLGIAGALWPRSRTAAAARADAALTHPHPLCGELNALFACSLSLTIRDALSSMQLHQAMQDWATEWKLSLELQAWLKAAATSPPEDYQNKMGWVRTAFGNAVWQLVNAPDARSGIIDTVRRGGDTDTNAAIAGALLGAVYGFESLPEQWRSAILDCRPASGTARVHRPRPEVFWPVAALELADALVLTGWPLYRNTRS